MMNAEDFPGVVSDFRQALADARGALETIDNPVLNLAQRRALGRLRTALDSLGARGANLIDVAAKVGWSAL